VSTAGLELPPPAAVGDLTYAQALAALEARGRYGIRLGLGRIRALLRELGNPQLGLRGALVAGTNGKGSVIALAGSALRAAGYRVGETPKPHLVTYRERLQVNGRPVDPETFARLVADLIPIADRVARRLGDPTEFEILTAAVFRWFADEAVDLALVEVGLGGRLDATHAWDGGVAAVTNVDLDHTDRLGPTIAAIAHEKAAIIERDDRAVTGATAEALAIIRRRAVRLRVPLTVAAPAPLLSWDRDGILVTLPGLGETRVGLRGRHQAANVAVADAVLDTLDAALIAHVPPEHRRRGYATARWPGRLELLTADGPRGAREILLDGAHNPAGGAVLAQALDDLRPFLAGGQDREPPPLTLITAAMADKDVSGVVGALARAGSLRGARIICTDVGLDRSLAAGELARLWAAALSGSRPVIESTPDGALERALREAPGPIVAAGSLYLVGALRGRLVDDPDLRDPEDFRTR
jgi:dihydrofolate synthase/folylpolyglutamate synthase